MLNIDLQMDFSGFFRRELVEKDVKIDCIELFIFYADKRNILQMILRRTCMQVRTINLEFTVRVLATSDGNCNCDQDL